MKVRNVLFGSVAIVISVGLAGCGGGKSDSESTGSSAGPSTTIATPGSDASGGGSAVDLTIAAAGPIPETKVTSAASPGTCQVGDGTVDVELLLAEVEGLAQSDSISLSTTITKLTIGGKTGSETDSLSGYIDTSSDASGGQTVTITDFPVKIGDTATTISGTVTCAAAG